MSRDPGDYQAAVLEVAGSAADRDAVLAMEGRRQRKLLSRATGLDRNLAKSAGRNLWGRYGYDRPPRRPESRP